MMKNDYLERILAARVYDVAVETPLEVAPNLSARLGNRLLLKREDMQPVFSFKCRGAYNKMVNLPPAALSRGVIASSAGNHAQGVALAAQKLACAATIVMPSTTPKIKVDAVRARGGEVVLHGDTYDEAYAQARQLEKARKLAFVHPYDDPRIMAGAGTSTLELLDEAGALDLVVIPAGGGGQLSGGAVAASGLVQAPRVVGVEPAAVGQWRASLAAGRPVHVEVGSTIADGQQLPSPGNLTFAVVKALVEDVVSVRDEQLLAAMRYLFERQKLVTEPSGSSALAAVLSGLVDVRGLRVGVILSGGNIAVDRFNTLLSSG